MLALTGTQTALFEIAIGDLLRDAHVRFPYVDAGVSGLTGS